MATKDAKLDIKPSDYTLALKIKDGHRYFWFKSPDTPGTGPETSWPSLTIAASIPT